MALSESKPGQMGQQEASVCGATVQLPSFDKIEPMAWFAVAEANFALRKVTDSTTKYYYVLSKLDSSTLRKLSAFLQVPRGEDPYQEIKVTLCGIFEPALEQKLDMLLATTDSGDTPPKEFGLELQRLLGKVSIDDILKMIFLRSIRPSIVTAITGSLNSKFEAVLDAADRAWKASSSSPGVATVTAIAGTPASTSRRGARGGKQRGSRSGGQTRAVQLCHFHLKFGNSAKRCIPACSWYGEQNRPHDTAAVFQVEEALDGEDADVGSENL